MYTYPNAVTHLLLSAFLTTWHRENAALLQQSEYNDFFKEWEIMVQKVDNTSKPSFNFMILLSPLFHDFRKINFCSDGHVYLSLETQTKYKQLILDIYATTIPQKEIESEAPVMVPQKKVTEPMLQKEITEGDCRRDKGTRGPKSPTLRDNPTKSSDSI